MKTHPGKAWSSTTPLILEKTASNQSASRSADILVGLLQANASEPTKMSALLLLNRC
jgi:hypothetical protein